MRRYIEEDIHGWEYTKKSIYDREYIEEYMEWGGEYIQRGIHTKKDIYDEGYI